MRSKLQEAFDDIRADDALKEQTLNYVLKKSQSKSVHKPSKKKMRRLIPAFSTIAAAAVMMVGIWIYLTPVSVISIDVNPSLEMDVNRFNHVVDVNAYNSDGQQLADQLNLKFKNYEDAVEILVNSDTIQTLLSRDEILSIVVTGENKAQSEKILSCIESSTDNQQNTYYYCADKEEVEEAHDHGMSYGKYHAYLQLHEYEPDLTPDDACHMTMKEIHNHLESHTSHQSGSSSAGTGTSSSDNTSGTDCIPDNSQSEHQYSQESGHHNEHHHGKHE